MQSFSYHAATARVRHLVGGVSEVVYAGPMGCDSFEHLRGLVLNATRNASCLVLRMDRVLNTMYCPPPPPGGAYYANRVPAAVIVRDDQFDVWEMYARQMAGQGVMRAVFLASFADQAHRWARATADAAGLAALQ